MSKPQMPRPNDCAALHHSDDGIAVLDFIGGNFELHESIIVGIAHNLGCAKLHQSGFICPNHLGIVHPMVGSTVGLLYPRVVDVLTGVVLEMLKHMSAGNGGLISMTVGCTVLDGIAIDQRDAIVSRGRNEITIRGLFNIIASTISTRVCKVIRVTYSAFGRSFLEHLVVSGKFIHNSRVHCGVAYFCCCATITLVGNIA